MKLTSFPLFLEIFVITLVLMGCNSTSPTAVPQTSWTPAPTATQSLPSPTPTATATQPLAASPTETILPTDQPAATDAPADSEPTPAPSLTPTPQDCEEKAAFYGDVTIPDDTFFEQGETFTKTWRFRNEGTCTWTTDYKLAFHSGDIMSGHLNQSFPTTVLPGEQVDLSMELVAPSRGGAQQGYWWFEDPTGKRFGTGSNQADTFWVRISVRFLDQNDQPQGNPGSQPPPTPPASCSVQRDPSVEAQVLTLVNQNRQANGLPALALDAALSEAAFIHSRDMACNSFVDHSGSDGSSWYDRIRVQGYSYSNANENIYVGFPQFGATAEGAVSWWMNSQVHRDNILNPRNVDAGIGYVYDIHTEWGGYYTMVFARP